MADRKLTHAEWLDEAKQRFGEDSAQWRFICPSCGHVASAKDYRDAGATDCHDTDENFIPPPTAAELEAAGQMRLVP